MNKGFSFLGLACSFSRTRVKSDSSHSQTITDFHPSLRSARRCTLSRAALPVSFSSQNSRRFVGVVQFLHPLWRCQKQPWTKITVLYFGRTISGLPGRFLTCRRKR